MTARYRFLPWVRLGAAASLATVDTLGAGVRGHATVPVTLRVNNRDSVHVTARLHGPGDVVSIDTRAVVRTDPPHLASEFEPNYFPLVEFDRPDMPWMFTPATGDARGRLRPWITLVVVRQQTGVGITVDPRSRRPVLHIDPPARPGEELPALDESWAWVHAQVVSTDGAAPLDALLAADSTLNLSRIVCPRRLTPNTSYLACVVPAFDAGRRSGLGLPVTADDERELRPAWESGANAPPAIALPVYYHWEFSTGEAGDFETLARRLAKRPLPEGVGSRRLSIRAPGFGLPDAGERSFGGALRLPQPPADAPIPAAFEAALTGLLNLPEQLRAQVGGDPIVAPPIYGGRHAVTTTVAPANVPKPWLEELNLDPRHRAAAGLGVLVVQDRQEELMASAWEQLGEVGREARQVRQPAFGAAVLGQVHARLAKLPADAFLEVSAPLHARVTLASASPGIRAAGAATVRQQFRASRTPPVMTSTAFRRVVRPHGPLVRRPQLAVTGIVAPLRFATHVALVQPAVFIRLPQPDMVTPQNVADHLARLTIPSLPDRIQKNILLREATQGVQNYFAEMVGIRRPFDQRPAVTPDLVRAPLLAALDPKRTVTAGVAGPTSPGTARETVPEAETEAVPEPVLPGPSFPQPMYEALRDLDPGLLLPGCDRIPSDTVVALESDAAFIESYMVGLNHEMSRELLWREYPSDERSTSFRTFWPAASLDPRAADQMPPLHHWTRPTALGSHFMSGSGGNLVLLVRGELLNRYPGTTIYLTRSTSPGAPGAERVYPLFRGRLASDMTFAGFGLTATTLRSEGWFVVLEQQPTEPRFGLDESTVTGRAPATLASWGDLAWGDLAATDAELEALVHIRLDGRLASHSIGPLEWGSNAGHMAAITLQRAFRVAFRFADLLPE
jgi:hypothetical protein